MVAFLVTYSIATSALSALIVIGPERNELTRSESLSYSLENNPEKVAH